MTDKVQQPVQTERKAIKVAVRRLEKLETTQQIRWDLEG